MPFRLRRFFARSRPPAPEGPVALALCAIAKDEARYIEEWVAFHLLQGVGAILVFDNESTDGTRRILDRLASREPVQVLDLPSRWDLDDLQKETYRRGAAHFSGRAQWVGFIDIDEFLFSGRGRSLPEELAEFGPDVGAIAVGHCVFGSSGHAGYAADLVTTRFVRSARPGHPQSRWFKTVARPELVDAFDSVHSVQLSGGAYAMADHGALRRSGPHPGLADRPGLGAIFLHHYMVKSREEFAWKAARARGKSIENRYTEAFFQFHDRLGDEVRNEELCRFAAPIRARLAEWRRTAP